MTSRVLYFVFIVSLFIPPLTEKAGAQDEEPGSLPPVLKACDEKGNHDGKIQREELPERLRRFFDSTDLDGDGVLTWQEVDEAKARARADAPKLEDVIGDLPPETLGLLGGKLHEVSWSEGKLLDASRKREIAYLIRFPKDREGLTAIVLLSHGGYGSSAGQYAYTDLATTYARLESLAVSIGHWQSANEIQHRYDRPLDVSFVIDALVRVRVASLRIPGGGGEGALPMPPDFKGIPGLINGKSSNNWASSPTIAMEKRIAREHFTMASAGWEMYPGHSWKAPRQYEFEGADKFIAWCQEAGLKVHGHGLGYACRVDWLKKMPAGTEAQRQELKAVYEDYVTRTAAHFAGRVQMWDVCNEQLLPAYIFNGYQTGHSYWKAYQQANQSPESGIEWYRQTFRLARAADPGVRWILLDFNNEIVCPKSDRMLRLVARLKSERVPVDGVGFQMHLGTDLNRPKNHGLKDDESYYASLKANLRRFAEEGLDLWITELDVRLDPAKDIASPVLAQTAPRADARFQQFDKNGDGKLNAEELPYPNLFKRLDKDGDGFLSAVGAGDLKMGRGQSLGTPATPADSPASGSTPAATSGFKPRPHGGEVTKAGLKPDVLARLDIAMQQAVANNEVSGVIGLIHRNGQRGYFEAFGWQDVEAQKPMLKDAIFRLQSMSQPVVAACAMALFDEGKFSLDEPISKHLPEWAEPKVLENGQLVPAKYPITPRMVMSHSIDVLGRYIEAVAGKPLDEVLRERILDPLKMTSTDFWVHPENGARICQIYKQPEPGVLQRGRDAGQLTEKPTFPGTRDAHGQFMGGTEALWLAGHEGKLFAALGYAADRPGDDPKPGAQIIRKDAPDAPWVVDHGFGPNYLRVERLLPFQHRAEYTDGRSPRCHRRLQPLPARHRSPNGRIALALWGLLAGCRDIEHPRCPANKAACSSSLLHHLSQFPVQHQNQTKEIR